ncbi:MAG TPA: GNAT family N-acetyltransferase [Firmicutes bacterium]|nr:GNAT family N-acetyltransferase [Bacillota bacterium]
MGKTMEKTTCQMVPAQSQTDLDKVHAAYRRDFPDNERKPFALILESCRAGRSEILLYKEEEEIRCYAVNNICSGYNCVLVDYLATDAQSRGKGYASAFMRGMAAHYHQKDALLLEIEKLGAGSDEAENTLRERRWHFYQRLGFQMMPVSLVLYGVPMHLLWKPLAADGVPQDYTEFTEKYLDIYRRLMGPEWTGRHVQPAPLKNAE